MTEVKHITKRVKLCRTCKEPLHKLVDLNNDWIGSWQCLNRQCKKYGIAVY